MIEASDAGRVTDQLLATPTLIAPSTSMIEAVMKTFAALIALGPVVRFCVPLWVAGAEIRSVLEPELMLRIVVP